MEHLKGVPSYTEPWPAAFFAQQTQAELSRGLTAPPLLQQVHPVPPNSLPPSPSTPLASPLQAAPGDGFNHYSSGKAATLLWLLHSFFSFEGQRGKRHLLSVNQEQIVLSSADALLGHLATTREM